MERNHYKIAGLSLFIFFAVICIAQPSTANAQQKIAFSTDRNGNSEIYLMNANGTNPVNLSNNPAFDATPSLSPKGNKIAFTSQRNGRFDVYTMNLDGSNQTNLTGNIGTSNFHPSYSWDGNKIVFVSNNSNGTAEILMMNADGSNPVFLGGVQSARDPSFSPDGSKVVFGGNIFGQYDIYVVSTAGSNPIPLTGDPAADIEPSFSPDGNKIAFTSARDGNEEIYLMNADGSNQVRLTQNAGVDTSPIYSPDGTKIAFSSDRPSGWDICVINLDGTNQVPLTSSPGFSNTSPSWRDLTFAPPGFINIEVTSEINEGGTATLSGGISNFDPSQSISLTINWGDGSEEMFNYPAGTNAFSKTHQYAENLFDVPYTVNATVSTANGSDSASEFVQVINVAPNLSLVQPEPAVIGSTFKLSGTVSDPGVLDTHTVNINWGDGSQITTLNLAAGVTNFSTNHTYAVLGAYTINVTASDDDGGTATPQNIFLGVVPQPTSGKIAFTSNFGGNNNIWLMNSNGTNQIALTTNSASDSYPNLSKDGTKIVFISDRDGNPEIYTMNAAGAFQTRLTNTCIRRSAVQPVDSTY